MRIFSVFVLCSLLALSGCAGKKNLIYADSGKGFRDFKELSDDEALQTVVLLHNVRVETPEEAQAKNIAISEFTEELKKRRSRTIEESGIFNEEYQKVEIDKWSDEELLRMFGYLRTKTEIAGSRSFSELTDQERGLSIINLTAKNAIAREGKKRENLRSFRSIFAQALMTALSVAISLI